MAPILAILGPGTLGLSLARWAATRGLEVRLLGRSEAHAQRALERLLARWSAPEGARIQVFPEPRSALEGASWMFEALPEELPLKASAWARLAPLLRPGTFPLTGSSSLEIEGLRRAAHLPTLVGFHPFVPVRDRRVVELISPRETPPEAYSGALHLAALLDLTVVQVEDRPGYAATRMGLVQGLEAIRLLEEGAASPRELDRLMVLGYGHPIGPLELTDRIGLDLRLALAERLYQETGEARFAPPELLRLKVARGESGLKSGQGFFRWEGGKRSE